MQNLVTVLSNEDGIQISLDVQQDAVLQIGEMMQEIQEAAYMNGENWAIFFQYYLEQYAPDLLEGLESDAEAGMYAAYYETAKQNGTVTTGGYIPKETQIYVDTSKEIKTIAKDIYIPITQAEYRNGYVTESGWVEKSTAYYTLSYDANKQCVDFIFT